MRTEQALREAKHRTPGPRGWVEGLARFGHATKGVVYLLIGGLAVSAAVGSGGATTGGRGAVATIADQPFGRVLLGLTAAGLFGYALWRLVQAALDPERRGTDAKGVAARLGYVLSAGAHIALGVAAAQMLAGGGGGGASKKSWIGEAMGDPVGIAIIGLLGAFVVGAGVYQLYKAKTAKFEEDLKTAEMSPKERSWVVRIGRFGLAARGVIFPIIGIYLIQAAITTDPSKAKGVGGALRELSQQPFGTFLLLVVAAGLVAYGVHMVVNARYRRIQTS